MNPTRTLRVRLEGAAAVEAALEAGERLRQMRRQVPHGRWAATVADAGLSTRTAERYVRLAERAPQVRAGIARGEIRSVREAEAAIAGREDAAELLQQIKSRPIVRRPTRRQLARLG